MGAKLIPSILATTTAQFNKRARIAEQLSRTVHLDMMDGKFVSTKSVGQRIIARHSWRGSVEVHAMVADPAALIPVFERMRPTIVYAQVELGNVLLPFMAEMKQRHITFGLAINPQTPITALIPFVRSIRSVLIMSVRPGKYQAPLWAGAFRRMGQVHRRWPNIEIAVDGSMNSTTIPRAIRAGATKIIVGSAVILQDRPQTAWNTLLAVSKQR